MGATRRQALGAVVAAALAAITYDAERDMAVFRFEGEDVSEDELDVAKEAMAVFVGGFPAGTNPEPADVAEKGRVAIRAMRLLKKD